MEQIKKHETCIKSSDGIEIYFDHYQSGHEKVIVIAPGFYNSKKAILFRQMAERLIDEYDVVVMDFRGHGKSKGLFTWTAHEDKDLSGVLESLSQDYKKIGVIGFSLGAAIGLITAAKTDLIDSLIAVCPPAQFEKIDFNIRKMGIRENVIYNFFQEGRVGKGVRPGPLWMEKNKPIEIVKEISAPTFFIHGMDDWLIFPWHSEELFKMANCKKKLDIIENGTHGEYIFRTFPDETIKRFKGWFGSTLTNG